MQRLHLFELADQPWFPRLLADGGTAYLHTLQRKAGLDAAMLPLFRRALDQSGAARIVDLCAGGGGPTPGVRDLLAADGRDVPLLLTDLQPNLDSLEDRALGHRVDLHPEPVDARMVPAGLTGLRTICNALHHLNENDAQAVLADAQHAGQPILVVELSARTLLNLTLGTLFIPLMVAALMPMVRPVRIPWLALTYMWPVLPWTIAWDGWVSHWRTYSLDEQRQLIAPLEQEGWVWEMGQEKVGPGHITWLWGHPADPTPAPAGSAPIG